MTRVTVFIDYQNLYHSARESFTDPRLAPPTDGHVHPVQLGILLTDRGKTIDSYRELVEVRVYRGQPGPKSHRNLVAAFDRQLAQWRVQERLTVRTRPLRYQPTAWERGRPTAWKAEEKGIDVMLALDIALGSRDALFDVAVVVSADTDLVPALEAALEAGVRVETATFSGPGASARALMVPGRRIWNHKLTETDFRSVADTTNYLHG